MRINVVQNTFKQYQWPLSFALVSNRLHVSLFKKSYYWYKVVVCSPSSTTDQHSLCNVGQISYCFQL